MLNKLSTREKMLLHILLCLVIIAGGIYLLIIPALSYNAKIKEDYAKVSVLRKQVETDISVLNTRKDAVVNESVKLEESKSAFLEVQPNYELDEKITKMINKRNLVSISMEINKAIINEGEPLELQAPTEPEQTDPTTEIDGIREDIAIGGDDEQMDIAGSADTPMVVEGSPIQTVAMNLIVTGSQENAIKLVDDFSKLDYIRVVSLDMGRADTTIILEIYMI